MKWWKSLARIVLGAIFGLLLQYAVTGATSLPMTSGRLWIFNWFGYCAAMALVTELSQEDKP